MRRSAEHPRSQLVPIAAGSLNGALEDVDGDDEIDTEQPRTMVMADVPDARPERPLWLKRAALACASLLVLTLIGTLAHRGGAGGSGGDNSEDNNSAETHAALFRRVPSAAGIEAHLRRYTASPHMAGSAADFATALYTRDTMRDFGLDAHLVEYQVLLSSPVSQALRIVGASPPPALVSYAPRLREAPVAGDAASATFEHTAPYATPFHGYSASGNVTG